MTPIDWLAIALVAGMATDLVTSWQARKQGRPYTIYHLIVAMVLGWLLLPLALVATLVLAAMGRLRG